MKIASIQYKIDDAKTKEERIGDIEKLIDKTSDADLILLPEMWNIGWRSFQEYQNQAETFEGPTITSIARKAQAHNSYIMAGTIVEKQDSKLFNTAVLVDPRGRVAAYYRKIHLVTRKGSEEYRYLSAGNEPVSIKTELGVFGFAVCYDLRFPELFRKMAVKHGVEVFLVPAAWPLVRVENWMDLNHVRANENLAYLISCNCVGENRGVRYLGHSTVVDPHGVPIASTGLFEDIVKTEIDVEDVQRVREEVGHLKNITLEI